jgi:hypothetical protein
MKKTCFQLAMILLAVSAFAQTPEPVLSGQNMMFFQKEPSDAAVRRLKESVETLKETVETMAYTFSLAGAVADLEPVKGAPYSATAVTEHTQVLADGNRITSKETSFQARDSEGRTRREVLAMMNFLPDNKREVLRKPIMISDPVSRRDYVLNLNDETARVMKHENDRIMIGRNKLESTQNALDPARRVAIRVTRDPVAAGAVGFARHDEPGESKQEDLGTQVIEGVACTGSRETRTIPAGAIGNERPIDIVSEIWTSPELKMVVLSKHSDPRFGENVYRLTDLNRAEPDPALFQLPSNYKIIENEIPRSK